jgi:hypothetical protein
MQNEIDEILENVSTTIAILQDAVNEAQFALAHADEDASNDTFFALVQMLRRLRVENNICIGTLCDNAMRDEL